MLATLLRQAGRKEEALAELEAERSMAAQEYGPVAKLVLYDQGMLYSELHRYEDARAAFTHHLASTANLGDKRTKAARQAAIQAMTALPDPTSIGPPGR